MSLLCVCAHLLLLMHCYNIIAMKGTEVPNPRRSSACDSTLKLAIGARVMLTANVDVSDGLLMVLEVKCACSDNQAARANQGRGGRSHVGGGQHR